MTDNEVVSVMRRVIEFTGSYEYLSKNGLADEQRRAIIPSQNETAEDDES